MSARQENRSHRNAKLAAEGQELLERQRSDMVSILQTLAANRKDTFIERLIEQAEKVRSYSQSEAIGSVFGPAATSCPGTRLP
jgi:hypothetical protein